MKKRTFFTTLALFLFSFNIAILLITTIMLKDNIHAQKERCLAEHYVIASSMIKDMQALESRNADVASALEELMKSYTYFSQNRKLSLAIYQGNYQVYSNIDLDNGFRFDASTLLLENRDISIQGKEHPVLSIVGRLPKPYQEYSLVYQFDMGEDFAKWRQTKNTLVLSGGIFSSLLAICLLLLMGHLFRPLGQISEASKSIAAGNYKNRLPISGHDELSELSRNFNHMVDEIENQIMVLQESTEQKQRFIDNFAHELRTPLTTIYGYAEYMQKALITEADKHSATDYIMSECKRMQSMAYQLLDLALLRDEKIIYDKVTVSELFRLVSDTICPQSSKKKIKISYQSEIDYLIGNQDLLQNLLINLIENAIKACDTDGNISVCAYEKNSEKIISIQDNGKGMSKEQLSHVKEAFYRVDKARSSKDGGTGLGLSLCEQIAKIHNAELKFLSNPSHGTIVNIIFTT